jgi:large subunit ribosomal protein L5
MWNFVANLINVALPRVRDFKGLSLKAFDGHGDYTIGIKEQIVFTEIFFDKIKRVRGFDITFVTSASNDKIAFSLLKSIGLPFGKR